MLKQRTIKFTGESLFQAVINIVLVILCIIMFYPFIYVVLASISDPVQFGMHTGVLLTPLGFDTGAYKAVLSNPNILSGYKNTLIYVSLGTVIQMAVTILSAYVLSRKGFLWKRLLTFFVVFTMFFNGGLIPTYLQVYALGISNSIWAMILPKAIITFNLIILRTAFEAVPENLEESVRIDGGNDFTILWNVVLPLSKPTIAIIVLFYAVGHWNTWFTAMLYLRDRSLYPLQLILREILVISSSTGATAATERYADTMKFATIIVATLPILFIYPILQKYFVKGMMVGAVKG